MSRIENAAAQTAEAQTAELLALFPKLVKADRETLIRYARARLAKYGSAEEAERLFVFPLASVRVARNVCLF